MKCNKRKKGFWANGAALAAWSNEMADTAGEIARVNALFVQEACEHRECKAALVAELAKARADLALAKQVCSDLEHHVRVTGAADRGVGADGEALRKRVRELEALEPENAALRKRVKEMEAGDKAFKHLRGVFLSGGV